MRREEEVSILKHPDTMSDDEVKELEMEMVEDILLNPVTEYSDTVSENIPKIVEKLKENGGVEKREEEDSVDPWDTNLSKLVTLLKKELKSRGFSWTRDLEPERKDYDRIENQVNKSNPVKKASGVAKQITKKDKLFRRGIVCKDRGNHQMSREYLARLAEEVLDTSKSEEDGLRSKMPNFGPTVAKVKKADLSDEEEEIAEKYLEGLKDLKDELELFLEDADG